MTRLRGTAHGQPPGIASTAVRLAIASLALLGQISTLDAQRAGILTGIVSDTAGSPLAGTMVQSGDLQAVVTNADGEYQLTLPPGVHRISVRAFAYPTVDREVTVADAGVTYAHFEIAPLDFEPVWRGCSLDFIPPDTKCILPRRIDALRLWVSDAGNRVFRAEHEWVDFWNRYWRDGRADPPPTPPAPAVDWTQSIVVAVSAGRRSGCGGERYINRILLHPDSIVVVIGPEETTASFTCMMIIAPVHVAVLPRRHYGDVVFRRLETIRRSWPDPDRLH